MPREAINTPRQKLELNGVRMSLDLKRFIAAMFLFCISGQALAVENWPAEPWTQATLLTTLDSDFQNNLSGVYWNESTQTAWACLNGPGKFWAIKKDAQSGQFSIDIKDSNRGEWTPGGDLEGITQVDENADLVYVLVEGDDYIRAYDTSVYGVVSLDQEWSIGAHVPTSGGAGSEGLTFVPDQWLASSGFTNSSGVPYTSQNGMGGLMFVAHQNGGKIYVFDLDPLSSSFTFVGAYSTSRSDSSGLEFDRNLGLLYIWHNPSNINYLEVSDLGSTLIGGGRKLNTIKEFLGPKTGNLEGFAIEPYTGAPQQAMVVDDDNNSGAAFMVFDQFEPGLPPAIEDDTFCFPIVGTGGRVAVVCL